MVEYLYIFWNFHKYSDISINTAEGYIYIYIYIYIDIYYIYIYVSTYIYIYIYVAIAFHHQIILFRSWVHLYLHLFYVPGPLKITN